MFVCIYILLFSFANISEARIVNSPAECTHQEHWVNAYTRVRNNKPENVTAHCALNPPGFDFWSPKIKQNKPESWPNKDEVFKKWTTEEVEKILAALGRLPDELKTDLVKGIYRFRKSKFHPNAGSQWDGDIVLYDNAFESERKLTQILAHELAHLLYARLSTQDIDDYGFALGWGKVTRGSATKLRRSCCFVQEDGKISPDEDFSNNIEYFLFESDKLKKVTPSAYDWIKRKFGDNFKLKEFPSRE